MSIGQKPREIAHGALFLDHVLKNVFNREILDRAANLGFSDWWLTAGCLAQTVWNIQSGRAPELGILDYDLFYFDLDTSWEAEDQVISQGSELFADLPITVEIRNQARVPIWYPEKFGIKYGVVVTASEGIDRFAYQTTAVGVRKSNAVSSIDAYRIYAPFGLDALINQRIVPNTRLPIRRVYEEKVARWLEIWPELDVLPWPDDSQDAGAK